MLPSSHNVAAQRVNSHQAKINNTLLLPEIDATTTPATRGGQLAYDVPTHQVVYADDTLLWQPAGNNRVSEVTLSDEHASLPHSRRLVSSASVTVTDNGAGSTLQLVDASSVTVSLSSAGGTTSLVSGTGSGPALAIKGLSAGAGVSLSSTGTDVTITNSSPASSVTLTSAGGTQSLVNAGSGTALALKGLTAGNNVALSTTANDVTISAAPSDIHTDRVFFADTANTDHTIAAENLGPGAVYECTALNAAHTLTLPTVASLLAAFPQLTTNSSYIVTFFHDNAAGGTLTIAANTGWTLAANTLNAGSSSFALILITDAVAQTAKMWRPSS